jgi:thiamine kinase-like enzyme
MIEGVTLDDVWEQIGPENRHSVLSEIVEALEKLHCIWPSDRKVKDALHNTSGDRENEVAVFGGPHTGFLHDGHDLLNAIMERTKIKTPFCSLDSPPNTQQTTVHSTHKDLGSLTIAHTDMSKWPLEAVFCHNDITPRNIILRLQSAPSEALSGSSQYKVAGIIEWDLAGFYPPSYELSLQDTHLPTRNRHVSFYLLLREYMKNTVPTLDPQVALLKAMELVFESQQRCLWEGCDMEARIRRRFFDEVGLRKNGTPFAGWVVGDGESSLVGHRRVAYENMVEEVVVGMDEERERKARRRKSTKAGENVRSILGSEQ